MRRTRRGAAILELMVYVGALALFTTAIGTAFSSGIRSHRLLVARAAAADRMERVFTLLRDQAALARGEAASRPGSLAFEQADGTVVRWYVLRGVLLRDTGPGTRREVVAARVKALTVKRPRAGVRYVGVTLDLALEGGTVAGDSLLRIGPPWRQP